MKTTFKYLIFFTALLLVFLTCADASQKYNASLMISPITVMQQLQQKQKIFLVDIRHENEFSLFKIPGSINIPLAFIKTKPFLKTRPLVLIHKSIGYSEIQKQAEQLNNFGFNTKILQGGLWAWQHKGGKIVGDPFVSKDLNKISAGTMFMEKNHKELIIINACQKELKTHKNCFPQAIHIPDTQKKMPDMIQSIFSNKTYSKKIPVSSLTSVVIFDETGQDYDTLEQKLDKKYRHQVFYLKGGIEGYQKFTTSHILANKPKSDRIKETGHCEPCKKKDNQEKRKP